MPAVFLSPAPGVESIAPAPTVFVSSAPDEEYISPLPAPGDAASRDFAVPVGMCKAGFPGEEARHAICDAVASGTGMCRPGSSGDGGHHASSLPVASGSGMCTAGSLLDDLTEYFSAQYCEFLEVREYKCQPRGKGTAKLFTVSVLLQKSFSCVRHRTGGGVAGSLDFQVTRRQYESQRLLHRRHSCGQTHC